MGLTFLCGVGPKRAKKLLAKVGDVETLFRLSDQQLSNRLDLPIERIRSFKRTDALSKAHLEHEQINRRGISVHSYLDSTYPRRLKQCEDAPLLVYSMGNFETNPIRSIAIVGTRNQTSYGNRLTVELVETLKQIDVQVVSGLAHGVDTIAHRSALDVGIETVGVLGHGLDRIYPAANRGLAKRMLSNGGLITEYITGTDPDREHFPMRNRIVAGMVDALGVVLVCGAARGVSDEVEDDVELVPKLVVAVTAKLYAVPLVKPVTVHEVVELEHVNPLGVDVAV